MTNAASDKPCALHVVRTYLNPTENWIYDQIRHIERYRSVIACKKLESADSFPIAPMYSLSSASAPRRLIDRGFSRILKHSPFFVAVAARERASIIHAHGGNIACRIGETAGKVGIPFVVSFYGVDMWKHPSGTAGLRRKYEGVFARGSLFLAEGPAAAAQLVSIGCNPDRIVVHRLGVDVHAIQFTPRSLEKGESLRVLMASRFAEKKGIPYGVSAFCRVATRYPDIHLTIVGKSHSSRDNRAADRIMAVARSYGVANRVDLLPFMPVDELVTLARGHHVLLHPSITASNGDSEGGHPVVMTLLAASGMPIVGTRHCDIPEVVESGSTGWIVPERDVAAIEEVLMEIIDNPSSLAGMSHASRRLTERKYDIRTQRLDSIYDRVLT